jgi:Zn-dependent peptidase ImmA (M78 family)
VSNKAHKAAQRLLEKTNFSMPVDIVALLLDHKIMVREERLEESVSGMLVIQDELSVAVLNSLHSKTRKRFTMAHELGHYLLHKHASRVFIDSSPIFFRDEKSSMGVELQEIEANAFAAELLMPEAILREKAEEAPFDFFSDEQTIAKWARSFGVSSHALSIRLVKLGLVRV